MINFWTAFFSIILVISFGYHFFKLRQTNPDGNIHLPTYGPGKNDLKYLFDLSIDMLCVADFNGYFQKLNPAWEKTLGYSREELLSKPYIDFVHPDDREKTLSAADDVADGDSVIFFENRYRCKDGSYKYLSWNARPLLEKKLIYCVARDVTITKRQQEDHVKLEEKLRVQEKFESLALFASGAAHDFNNIFQSIIGHIELCLLDEMIDLEVLECLNQVKESALKATDITFQLLAYTGKNVFIYSPLNLSLFVQEIEFFIKQNISEDINLSLELNREVPMIQADSTLIRQILLNIILNADNSISEKEGHIKIKIDVASIDRSYLEECYPNNDLKTGKYVTLEVTDDGGGMSPDQKNKIFDPFYSTKNGSKGLGLTSTLGIMRGHRGVIKVDSQLMKGTTITLVFPLGERVNFTTRQAIDFSKTLDPGKVLVVDDEPYVLLFVKKALERSGFQVITARNASEALLWLRFHKQEVTLIILDMTMPGMNGGDAIHEIRKLGCHCPVLLTSGYHQSSVLSQVDDKEIAAFLQKTLYN